nr:cytochrome c oxidase subunit 2 [Gastrodia angusta]
MICLFDFLFLRILELEGRFLTIAPCDAAEPWQLGSQDAATPMMQGIIDLHHDIFFFLILILVFVSRMLVRALWHFHEQTNPIPQRIVHGTTIEILRTIFPSLILMFIAIPSFALLYSMDEVVVDPAITIKAIGHQWYRSAPLHDGFQYRWRASTQPYEYSDYNSSDEQSLTFDSYTIQEDDLELGQSRFLEVDNRVVVPAKTHIRMIVTPADVPHSWAVPSSGVKCDAVPGRSNQTSISVLREGVYYGQCSEIRGTNHAFMRQGPSGLTPIYRRRSCSFERLWFSGIQSINPPNRGSWSVNQIVG